MRDRVVKILSTLFGVGYLPIMPGTFASIFGLILYLLIKDYYLVYIIFTIIFIILGFTVAGRAQELFRKTDPSQVVIDELSGILIVYLLIPFSISNLILGFIIFRLLDILKPYPISGLENLKKGWGIMLDDIAAGVLTNIILQVTAHIRF